MLSLTEAEIFFFPPHINIKSITYEEGGRTVALLFHDNTPAPALVRFAGRLAGSYAFWPLDGTKSHTLGL